MFGAPTGNLGLAHVCGRLNRRDKLENNVADADNADNRAGNFAENGITKDEATDEDVDYRGQTESELTDLIRTYRHLVR